MKNAFYFALKAFFVLKIVKFLSLLYAHVEKRLDEKDKSKLDVTAWLKINCITHIDQYLMK